MADDATSTPDLAQAMNRLEDALQDFRRAVKAAGIPRAVGGPIFKALRQWRSEQARSKALPPYVIATDAALLAIEEAKPSSVEELRVIRGVGGKADIYGADILKVVAACA